jgi:hypothetical protein
VRGARARIARIGRGHLIKTLGQDWQHGEDAIEDRKDRKETFNKNTRTRLAAWKVCNRRW